MMASHRPLSIRPATPADAMELVVFVDMASEGLASYFWSTMCEPGQSPIEVGRSRVLRDEGAFTWRNGHIAEVDGTTAGALIGYVIADPVDPARVASAPDMIRSLVELEAMAPGRWYVNVLAVHPEYRGQGIGQKLLAHADDLGRKDAPSGMAIIVASTNLPAVRLYRKVGFSPVAERPIPPFPGAKPGTDWILLTKPHS